MLPFSNYSARNLCARLRFQEYAGQLFTESVHYSSNIFSELTGGFRPEFLRSVSISASNRIELTKRLENEGHNLSIFALLGQLGDLHHLLGSVFNDIEIDNLSNNLREKRSGGQDRRQKAAGEAIQSTVPQL